MSMTLKEMFDSHEALKMPIKAKDDELDDLLFMIIDLETVVMGYAEALLSGIVPKFDLDADHAEKQLRSLMRLNEMCDEDQAIRNELVIIIQSLIRLRDYMKIDN